ncbi:DUF4279 domain-containing protein [Holdemania massiliensis]|uniref:DUF4279 domain-containing protein n=1 Tax=Holdemania massiliensis TaxID=1468449 RepID=UPI001F05AA2C|nr:DUF4279 domain-containing protein [Holdemania massiliensis]MCH1939866.1 DUF4279 domain-containing protein [Holdemania massiliensis]
MERTNVKVSLRFIGEDYDIQEITDTLNIIPSESWNKGEPIRNSGKKRTYTAWIYSLDAIETLDVCEQAKKIEKVFSPKGEKIATLKKKYNLDVSVDFVIIIENEDVPAIYFDASFIEFAAKIGARFDLDTYVN